MEVVAICDPSERCIQIAREKYGDPKVYEDHRDLVKDPSVDWVFIGSWNCFHREHAVAALKAGKHVFCEKPLATNLDDCLAIKRAQESSGRICVVGFTLRFSNHYRRIKDVIDSGAVGDVVSMEFNETLTFDHGGFFHGHWRRLTEQSGTAILEKCCHDLDVVNWMLGSIPRRVASFGGTNFFNPAHQHYVEKIGKSPDGKDAFFAWGCMNGRTIENPFTARKDIIDNQVAILEYANDTRATFHMNCSTNLPERRMYICGTDGTLRADVIPGVIELRRLGYDVETERLDTGAKGGHGGGDEVMHQELVDAIVKGVVPESGIDEGLKSAITAFGIDQAMQSGSVVDMDPLWKKAGIVREDAK